MDQKQAITRVLEFCKQYEITDNDLLEAIKMLDNYVKLKGRGMWDEQKIRSAVEKFIEENGRTPYVKECDRLAYMPKHTSIERCFGMKAGKWLLLNYPADNPDELKFSRTYKQISSDEVIQRFIDEYTSLKPLTCLEYNGRRKDSAPSWQYVARTVKVKRWTELKDLLKLDTYYKEQPKITFKVNSSIR